jgi:hypothetical protein
MRRLESQSEVQESRIVAWWRLTLVTSKLFERLLRIKSCRSVCSRAAADCRNNYVWVEHANGEWTNYSHLARGSASELAKLQVGDDVAAGAFIGHEAAVGCAMLDQVHFEVAVADRRTSIDSGGFLLATRAASARGVRSFCNVPGEAVLKNGTYRAACLLKWADEGSVVFRCSCRGEVHIEHFPTCHGRSALASTE